MINKCLMCGSEKLQSFVQQDEVPASISQLKVELKGKLDIVYCKDCFHIFNRSFDSEIVKKIYDNEEYSACLPLSPEIIKRLHIIAELFGDIENKTIIEVGASDFTFSEILLEKKAKKIIALEPSKVFSTDNPNIVHIKDFLNDENLEEYFPIGDLIIFRHVFEHLVNPLEILKQTAQNMKVGGMLYIEVPNAVDILEKNRIYDFFYEHINYYNPDLFANSLNALGLKPLETKYLVNGQHFGILAEKVESKIDFENIPIDLSTKIDSFTDSIKTFEDAFNDIISQNNNVAIYGAGGHSVSITTRLKLSKEIKCMFDLSPVKIGTLSPLCHIPIVKPTKESIKDIDCIIIVASLHQDEIFKFLTDDLEFKGKIFGTYPDIKILSNP